MKQNIRLKRAMTTMGLVYLALLVATCATRAHAETKEEVTATIRETAITYGVDPSLALAIAEVESGLNPKAVGALGELGVFQLRPEYHGKNLQELKRNSEVAMRYLVEIKAACADYGEAYFICWNLGPNYRRLKHPTRFEYFKRVMSAKSRLTKM
jgi:hypothetical protein